MSKDKQPAEYVIDVIETGDVWSWTMVHRTGTSSRGTARTKAEAREAAQQAAESVADEPHGPA